MEMSDWEEDAQMDEYLDDMEELRKLRRENQDLKDELAVLREIFEKVCRQLGDIKWDLDELRRKV